MPIIINQDGTKEVSQEEYDKNILPATSLWNKANHICTINVYHDEVFDRMLSENGYTDMAELSLWSQQPDSLFRSEATAIKAWYINTCEIICNYEATVTEQTAIDPIDFINSLPKYNG